MVNGKTQLLVRGIDASSILALKERAKRNRRSLEAEARTILEEAAADNSAARRARAIEMASRIKAEMRGRVQRTNSTDIIRELRDR